MVHNVRIFVRSSFEKPEDIDPHGTPPGTLICGEEEIVEQQVVTGIAFSKDEAQISIRRVQDKPGVAAAIFGPLAEANVNVDMIVQTVSSDGATTDLTFTVPASDYERAADVLAKARPNIGYERLDGATDIAKVSVIGIGMRRQHMQILNLSTYGNISPVELDCFGALRHGRASRSARLETGEQDEMARIGCIGLQMMQDAASGRHPAGGNDDLGHAHGVQLF
jgi:predicted amino acid-binding ACT domain protein